MGSNKFQAITEARFSFILSIMTVPSKAGAVRYPSV
jgi:hypothetical protein